MRISDWSSDVCSSDLRQSFRSATAASSHTDLQGCEVIFVARDLVHELAHRQAPHVVVIPACNHFLLPASIDSPHVGLLQQHLFGHPADALLDVVRLGPLTAHPPQLSTALALADLLTPVAAIPSDNSG